MTTEAPDRPEEEHDPRFFRWLVCPYPDCETHKATGIIEFDLRLKHERKIVCSANHPAVTLRMLYRDHLVRVWID